MSHDLTEDQQHDDRRLTSSCGPAIPLSDLPRSLSDAERKRETELLVAAMWPAYERAMKKAKRLR